MGVKKNGAGSCVPWRMKTLVCCMALAGYAQAEPYIEAGKPGDPQSWRSPEFQTGWGLGGMHADAAYAQGINGAGVKIGILDSGFDSTHPEFDPSRFHSVTASGTYIDGSIFSVSGLKNDNNDSHGTKVSGVIGASRDGTGMHGVAYGADIFVGNTNQNDSFLFGPKPDANYFTAVYNALQAAGVRVINNSWGSQPKDVTYDTLAGLQAAYAQHFGKTTWLDAAAKVSHEGVINVFSAGNSGYHNASVRSALPYFRPELEGHWLAVSGMRENGTQIYNQCGVAKYWCVAAPTIVTSTGLNGTYSSFNGTSAAAPHATGALALIMARFPYMTNEQALSVLFTTAEQVAGQMSEAPIALTGWGLPNLQNAMAGPGQLLGSFNANLPAGSVDVWSNNISDRALLQREQEDRAEHEVWLKTLQEKGWQQGLSTNASVEEQSEYATGLAREAAYQQRVYQGSLVKSGAGELILTGNNTYRGPTMVNEGLLAVNGSVTSDVTVQNAGVLGGSGTVGSLTARSGGTVAPGNSIGTLNVARNVSFEPGSRYAVEVAPNGQSDRIQSSGSATIGGGEVAVSLENSTNLLSQSEVRSLLGQQYNILTAQQGISGRFDSVAPNYLFLGTGLTYQPNQVTLNVGRNDTSFASVAQTQNERAVAAAADALAVGNPVYESILNAGSAGEARQAFRQLSGQIHADIASAQVNDSRYLRDALNGRLRQAEGLATSPDIKADDDGGAWAQLLGAWDHASGDANATGYQASTYGVLVGLDSALADDWRLGVATGYTRTSLDGGYGSNADSDNYHLAVYGGKQFGELALRAGGGYTWHRFDTSRSVNYGMQSDRETAKYSARTEQVFAEAGYSVKADWVNLEPFANLAYINFQNNGISEDGGAAALHGDKQHTDATVSTLGLRADTEWQASKTTSVALRSELGWQHQYGDLDRGTGLRFNGGTSPFVVNSVSASRDGAVLKASAEVAVNKNATLSLGYGGLLSQNYQDNSVNAGFTWKF
ncbi:autotransporter outer membrane beta-barrel domain-containing protein [Serratia proteamaculans]|uniref:autotransporter outer membrane beta-barrel domain-containing protein n=1 Tax=Serratia proteamaculans TaxID=28151 RepID=UPI003CEDF3C7